MRLTAEFWVQAYIARLRGLDIPAFVVSHGDNKAGAVFVKLNTLDGNAVLFQRVFDLMSDQRKWDVMVSGDEETIDQAIQKQRRFDTDIWVIEVEDRQGRHLLDELGLDG